MALQNGDRYGRLVILGIDRQDKHRNNIYKCRCDCGNITFVRGNGLTSGNTKSCGCLSSEVKRSKRLPKDQGVINHIILQYKRHARDRGLSWNLTYEYLIIYHGKLYKCEGVCVSEVAQYAAIGAGSPYALAALSLEHDCVEAVRIASELCVYVHTPVHWYQAYDPTKAHGKRLVFSDQD